MNHRMDLKAENARGAQGNQAALAAHKLRKALKYADDPELPMDESFYDRLHDQVMAAIETKEVQPLSKMNSTQAWIKRHWRPWSVNLATGFLGVVAMIGVSMKAGQFLSDLWSSNHTVQMVQNEKQILEEALSSPEDFSDSLISSQSSDDFFLDMADQALSKKSKKL